MVDNRKTPADLQLVKQLNKRHSSIIIPANKNVFMKVKMASSIVRAFMMGSY